MEFSANGRQAIDDQKVVERIERPSKKTGEHGRILIGRRGRVYSGVCYWVNFVH